MPRSEPRKLSYKAAARWMSCRPASRPCKPRSPRVDTKLADATLYVRDPVTFNAAMTKLSTTQAALTTAEDEWLELETLREELAG